MHAHHTEHARWKSLSWVGGGGWHLVVFLKHTCHVSLNGISPMGPGAVSLSVDSSEQRRGETGKKKQRN